MVQHGLEPSDWKTMSGVGTGVSEIRVHCETEYRVLYVAKFERAIYVLHAFTKKTRRTPIAAHRLARARYRQMLMWEEQS
jgi:phage-related protein